MAPEATYPLVHVLFSVVLVTVVEECASNVTFTVFPSASVAVDDTAGVVSEV